jgi:hypothetical protein
MTVGFLDVGLWFNTFLALYIIWLLHRGAFNPIFGGRKNGN